MPNPHETDILQNLYGDIRQVLLQIAASVDPVKIATLNALIAAMDAEIPNPGAAHSTSDYLIMRDAITRVIYELPVSALAGATPMQYTMRSANSPRAISNGRGLKYVAPLDKILIVEAAATLRLLEINRISDHLISRIALAGKTPGAFCYANNSGLLWFANATTNIFAVNPTGWTNPVSAVGGRSNVGLYYNTTNGAIYGFDDSATPAIRKMDSTTGAVLQTTTVGLANSFCNSTEYPIAYVAANDCFYFLDLFGNLRKFNCATQAVTLIASVTGYGSGQQSILKATDGLLYIVSNIGTNLQKVTVLNPATDLVVTTIDLGPYMYVTTQGFHSIAEIQGYLYVSMNATESTNWSAIFVIRMSDYAVTGSLQSYGQSGPVAGPATGTQGDGRIYSGVNPFNSQSINAYDR